MAAGGIYDHVGGGFARYSTDTVWLVPHFEKMLYDQALLVGAYLRGHLVTGSDALPRGRRGDHRVRAARPAPRRRRLLLGRGRRLGGRGGQVLPLVARRDRGALRRRRRRGAALSSASARGGQLHRPAHAVLGQHPAPGRPARGAPGRGPARPARALRGARAARATGLDDKVLTAWNALFTRSLHRGGGGLRPDRLDGRGPREPALPPRPPPTRGSAAAVVAGRRRCPAPRRRRGLRRPDRRARDRGRVRRRRLARGRGRARRRAARPLRRRGQRRLLHHRVRRGGAHRATPGLLRQRDAERELTGRRRAAPPGRGDRRRHPCRRHAPACWRCSAPR